MTIRQTILKIKTAPALDAHGNSLRGFLAARYPQNSILHNHSESGRVIYVYPRIQYKVLSGEGYIIGIDEGSELVRDMEPALEVIELKGVSYRIIEKQLITGNKRFGLTEEAQNYTFCKPWLALNEENYIKYRNFSNQKAAKEFLANILCANLLSIAKSLGYVVDGQITITSLKVKAQETFLKGTPMLGFLGSFSVNFDIPDYWGIGKSVSRGFGTVKRLCSS